MQMYPVQEYIPKDLGRFNHEYISVVYNGITVVSDKDSLARVGIICWSDKGNFSVRHYKNACVQVEFNSDEISWLHVTDINDLIPLALLLEKEHGTVSIKTNIDGVRELMAYDTNDPSTNPMLCKDCGT